MKKKNNNTVTTVLVIGSGPIVIGQAAEFDYAGTQACKSLREEGIKTILINSNPATIMTDQGIADKIYIEPLTPEILEKIIKKERPEGILPTLGGQTALNLAVKLDDLGILNKYGVKLLGTSIESIKKAEDRALFRTLLNEINEPHPPSMVISKVTQLDDVLKNIGLPLVVRPAYTLGGTGGGFANNKHELEELIKHGINISPVNQVLVERSLLGWKEIEYEVMRDSSDNCITICNMENIDPMGVHTGDSIVIAPSQTMSDKEYQMLRSASLKIIKALNIQGGCNVQFALPPHPEIQNSLNTSWQSSEKYYVIEVNPRVSRSSALASKATGYPIARVAAKIAIGKLLKEIPNSVTKKTKAAFEPALDYCVIKIPRWPFDKFPHANRKLSTQMKGTGEVMAIDTCFEGALQKAVRSLEISNKTLLWQDPKWNKTLHNLYVFIQKHPNYSKNQIVEELSKKTNFKDFFELLMPNDLRLWSLTAAIRQGISLKLLSQITMIDPWFITGISNIINTEKILLNNSLNKELLLLAKRQGFTDEQIATLCDSLPDSIKKMRKQFGIQPAYKMVDTCAAEFEAATPYFFSTYEGENEAKPLKSLKAIVIGSGPIRIGQGIEFDYSSVHAAIGLQKHGYKSIMVNSNPETVSTDFDASDRLYFEPLDVEAIENILENEEYLINEKIPSIVQFGGQTAINISQSIAKSGFPILGSSAHSIDIASDREQFEKFLEHHNIPKPPGETVTNANDAMLVADKIGYPILIRPSYVIGGKSMEIVQTPNELDVYLKSQIQFDEHTNILIDKYFEGIECEVDAVSDNNEVLIAGIMEHIERAGVHSGDSIAIYPPQNLTKQEIEQIIEYTKKITLGLEVTGLINIQYVIIRNSKTTQTQSKNQTSSVYVIEANPRASRTIPFISKMTKIPMVSLALGTILGKSLKTLGYKGGLWKTPNNIIGIKAPVFSMSKLTGVDTNLGPEMKSTGEVMGIDHSLDGALTKALSAASLTINHNSSILLSIADKDKNEALILAKQLIRKKCKLYATEGTARMLSNANIPVTEITKKLNEGHPNAVDIIEQKIVQAVINTVSETAIAIRDGFKIRRSAVEQQIPCFTFIDTAKFAIQNINSHPSYNVKTIEEYTNS